MAKPRLVARIGVSVALVRRTDRAFLLVERAKPPAKNMWAFAGGKVEFGETLEQAAVRELHEETAIALCGSQLRFQKPIEIIARDGDEPVSHYVLMCFSAWVNDVEAVAGDDAADAGFFSLNEMGSLPVTATTLEMA
ncbi:MAG: NUDIX domain-containing protein, partial [Pseudomonadota bacterium]